MANGTTEVPTKRAEVLHPARMRLGSVLKLVLPILTASHRRHETMTVTEIEAAIHEPTAGVRRVVDRLSRAYVPGADGTKRAYSPIVVVKPHPEKTWTDAAGVARPVGVVELTEAGYSWALDVIEAAPRGRQAQRSLFEKLRTV